MPLGFPTSCMRTYARVAKSYYRKQQRKFQLGPEKPGLRIGNCDSPITLRVWLYFPPWSKFFIWLLGPHPLLLLLLHFGHSSQSLSWPSGCSHASLSICPPPLVDVMGLMMSLLSIPWYFCIYISARTLPWAWAHSLSLLNISTECESHLRTDTSDPEVLGSSPKSVQPTFFPISIDSESILAVAQAEIT